MLGDLRFRQSMEMAKMGRIFIVWVKSFVFCCLNFDYLCINFLSRSEDENSMELVGWMVASKNKARVTYKVTVRPWCAVPELPKISKTQMKKRFKANIWAWFRWHTTRHLQTHRLHHLVWAEVVNIMAWRSHIWLKPYDKSYVSLCSPMFKHEHVYQNTYSSRKPMIFLVKDLLCESLFKNKHFSTQLLRFKLSLRHRLVC